MSRSKTAPFGNAVVNIVTGELQIAGSVAIDPGGTITGALHTLDTNTCITFIDTVGLGSITVTMPAFDAVPVGWTMTFKDVGPFGIGDSVRIRGPVAGQDIDGAGSITLNSSYESVTLRNTGVIGVTWLIVGYFSGKPPI